MSDSTDTDAQGRDDARISEIRIRHAPFDFGMHHPISGEWVSRAICKGCCESWPCEQEVLRARLDALEAERDEARAWSARWHESARWLRRSARQHYESWLRACENERRLTARLTAAEAARDERDAEIRRLVGVMCEAHYDLSVGREEEARAKLETGLPANNPFVDAAVSAHFRGER